jgi:hypothetical protein
MGGYRRLVKDFYATSVASAKRQAAAWLTARPGRHPTAAKMVLVYDSQEFVRPYPWSKFFYEVK